jgi:FkbM family methyltransferase
MRSLIYWKSLLRKRLGRLRRRLYEATDQERYSRPALAGIDRKLEKYLPFEGGVFIEAGANDGYTQSNTYYLERRRGWRGVLVEPIPTLFEQCRRERPASRVFRCALVPRDYPDDTVHMHFANLMSLVSGARKSAEADREHIERGIQAQSRLEQSYEIEVPARTLSSVLDETEFKDIDLLSLDVEGYELQVLKGLDFERYAPKYMLIEATFRAEIEEYIGDRYEVVDMLSHHDVLYRKKDR